MNFQTITITYEDGTVVQGEVPDCLLLANAQWVDWLIASNDPICDDSTTKE
jgi:hypothetical protein